MGGQHLNRPVVGISPDEATGGYWEVATDGGIFAFGAPFFGSTGNLVLNRPVNGMAASPDGGGLLVRGLRRGHLRLRGRRLPRIDGSHCPQRAGGGDGRRPVGGGYWLVAADGGIFSFGAPFEGAD